MGIGTKGDFKETIFSEINENVKALESLFPSVVKDGQVDFEALKEALGEFEEVGPEKYELTWSGKKNAKKVSQQDIVAKTLKYIPEDSVNPETTENLYIEGDNLEVLKLLRQNYYGAIKMIYIDPPYNTGNDFVYNDNFSMDKVNSDIEEGEISDLGEKYTINSKSTNKYHANWLNMMYPRLRIAKDLLKDDGVIFISIDDNEVSNLKNLCNTIFGEENFVVNIIWEKKYSPQNDAKYFSINHDNILCYAKNKEKWNRKLLPATQEQMNRYKNLDNDIRGVWKSGDLSVARLTQKDRYEITTPSGRKVLPPSGRSWSVSKEKFKELVEENRIWFGEDGNNVPSLKRFFSETNQGMVPISIWYNKDVGHTQSAKQNLKKLFGDKDYFDTPKSIELIKRMIYLSCDDEDIVLDFFSGSSSTAHSVMQLNSEYNRRTKFIMVQLPEIIDNKNQAYKDGYINICEIGKERIRRAGEKIKEENKDKEGIENLDIGFKVFRVSDTNIRWIRESDELRTLTNEVISKENIQETTFNYIAATTSQVAFDEIVPPKDRLDFMPGFKDIDVVYELLLRQRDIPLSAMVIQLEEIGKRTYLFDESFLVCLEEYITNELVEKLSSINPLPIKFILRDSAFGDDINLKDETNRRLKTLIERNTGETKKTYTVEYI